MPHSRRSSSNSATSCPAPRCSRAFRDRPDDDRSAHTTSAYPFWIREKIRYADTDRQGHVNNAVFATFCESGRVALFYEAGEKLAPPGCEFVIVRLELDFRAEMRWPGEADIGTVALDIGRSSFRLGQGIFCDDLCAATAQTVIVLLDSATRRATPLPDATRAGLLARARV